jgi:hypothetical protein
MSRAYNASPEHPSYNKWWRCVYCPKRTFASRKGAKRVNRMSGGKMSICKACNGQDGWHIGHLPGVIKHGEKTRSDLYGAA